MLEEKIGEGGMGAVLLARQVFLRRPTALKDVTTRRSVPEEVASFKPSRRP